jgi:TRAP-type C4-dicarboxylate transport system permease small subunit
MKKIRELNEKCWRFTSIIAGIIMTCYMLLVIVNIFMRRFGGRPIFGIIELICYASLASCCFALAQTEWKNGNIIMPLVLENVPRKVRMILEIIGGLVSVGGITYVTVQCFKNTLTTYNTGGGTIDLHIPLYIVILILSLGFLMLDLCIIMKLILKIGEAVNPGDESETESPEIKENNVQLPI